MAVITIDREEFTSRCEGVYERNRTILEKRHRGKIVALHEDGIAGIGNTTDEAYAEAVKKYPKRIMYFRRIGKFAVADFVL